MKNTYLLFTVLMLVISTILMCRGWYIIGIIFIAMTYLLAFLGIVNSLTSLIDLDA